jgi:hypothetical protein
MIRDNQINPRRNLTRSDVPPISKHERRKTQPRERERERDQYPILIMDLACLRSTKTAEKQTHLRKQNLQNPKCKKEGKRYRMVGDNEKENVTSD